MPGKSVIFVFRGFGQGLPGIGPAARTDSANPDKPQTNR